MASSIYIHIPFCKTICNYCDFCKMFYNEDLANNYLEELKKEINSYNLKDTYKTIYIGGGTPSHLSIHLLEKLFSYIKDIKLEDNYEFTIECNIDDITEEKLKLFRNNRVNRLSIGVETINSKLQKVINRHHTKDEVIDKINLSKKYFNNINVDLIYAIPGETIEILKEDLDFITSFDVSHISLYSLIIEEHTRLYIDGVEPIDESLDNKMYYYILNYLKGKGYKHYEVSNFAKEGKESRHNLTYWNNEEYYGIGLGASGYLNDVRYTNTRSINKYLKGEYISTKENISKEVSMENELILGLRKIQGIDINVFKNKYKVNLLDNSIIKKLLNEKLLVLKSNNIYISEDNYYISNYILNNFIGGFNE